MSSFAPWIILILIAFFFGGKIYRDLKQGRSKGVIVLQVILLLGIIGFFVISQNGVKKGHELESGRTDNTKTETAEVETGRVTNLLFGLEDYFGELNQTDNPQAQLYLRQGLEYRVNREYPQSLETFAQVLDSNLTEGERLGFLILTGNSEAFLKNYDDAINYHYQAEKLAKSTDQDTALAVVYSNLALLYQLNDDPKGALGNYFNLLVVDRRLEDKSGEKNSLANIGFIYQMLGNTDSAEVYHKRSLEVASTPEDLLTQAAQLNNLALTYRNKGMPDSALVLYSQSLLLFQQAGNDKDAASVLTNVGLIYQEKGNLEQALDYHRQAWAIDSTLGDLMGQAGDLANIGSALEQKGEFTQALDFYRRSVSLFENAGAKKETEFVKESVRRVESKIKN
ncbi:MAG TPA: tetratricopeptide repeat protein [candidate division Zixibacteria bacterium]